jgi:hypothetical protein
MDNSMCPFSRELDFVGLIQVIFHAFEHRYYSVYSIYDLNTSVLFSHRCNKEVKGHDSCVANGIKPSYVQSAGYLVSYLDHHSV